MTFVSNCVNKIKISLGSTFSCRTLQIFSRLLIHDSHSPFPFLYPAAPIIIAGRKVTNKTVTAGKNIKLICFVDKDSKDGATYRWAKNGETITAGGRLRVRPFRALRIRKVKLNDAGHYKCTVSNKDGKNSIVVNLRVRVKKGKRLLGTF